MLCNVCKNEQPDSHKFCSDCGNKLEDVSANRICQAPGISPDKRYGSNENAPGNNRTCDANEMDYSIPSGSKDDAPGNKRQRVCNEMDCAIPSGPQKEKTPRKIRQSYSLKDKAFAEEEKKILRSFAENETQTRKNIQEVYRKCNAFFTEDVSDEIAFIKNKLKAFEEKTSLDPVCIGLLGSTGAGKSSLLNAIVKEQDFLPVSGHRVCTSSLIEVKNDCKARCFKAKINFLSVGEWHQELERLIDLCTYDTDNNDEDEDNDDIIIDARNKIKAVYGELALNKSFEQIINTHRQPRNDCITLTGNNAEDLSDKLDPYIRVNTEETETGIPWPLVKNVEVTIPRSDVLPEGVILLDMPGTGDANKERDQMWKKNLNKCSVIWIISSFERAMEKNTEKVILNESIKAVNGGMCFHIAVIVTKSDIISLVEFRREQKRLGRRQAENKHDAIIERNKIMKTSQRDKLERKIQKKLSSDYEILQETDLVYTVSAQEYWNNERNERTDLSAEETEILNLRDYIRKMCIKEKKKMLQEYVKECFGVLSLIQIINSEGNMQENYPNTVLEEQLKDLEKGISKHFSKLEKPLSQGVIAALKSYKTNKKAVLTTQTRDNRGFHNKLKAMCRNNGVLVSSTSRQDLNSILAEPIYNDICDVFRNTFSRTAYATRSTLAYVLIEFQNGIKEEIKKIFKKYKTDNSILHRQNILMKMIDAIFVGIQRHINWKKEAVFDSLWISIQCDLEPAYTEAANIKGPDSCRRMQEILERALTDDCAKKMFQKAEVEMLKEIQKLKDDIIKQLKEEISSTLKLAFSYTNMPDVYDEYEEVREIYDGLFQN